MKRLAVITGGSRGLGAALCQSLSDQGYQVCEFSRSAPHPYSVSVDLADPANSYATITHALEPLASREWDELLIINNAGTLDPIGFVGKQRPAAILANLNANLQAGVLFLSAVVEKFQAHRGRKVMVNISSGAALKAKAGWSLYCAAKAGMENFIRALAQEQEQEQATQPAPFTAINIDPGVIDTAMQAAIRACRGEDFPEVGRFIERKNNGQLVAPESVAAAVLKIAGQPNLENGARYNVADFF